MAMSTPMLVTFLVYIFGMVLIGLAAYRSTTTLSDYILGGRRMGSVVTALSAGASDMSGWLLMGLPGAIFISGISESWIAIGLTIGAYLNWRWVAGRLRVHTEVNHNALTLPDRLFHTPFRRHQKNPESHCGLDYSGFFTIYCASGIVAGARLFESTFGMSYATSLWAGAAATIAYTFIGGYLAASWTYTVQATLMIFALILTPVMVILALDGIDTSLLVIAAKNSANLDMFKGLDVIAIISLLGWGLGYFGQPHILARFMAADSHHTIRSARRISITWMILCLAGAVSVGFFGIAYFSNYPEQAGNVTNNAERVFIELSMLLLNPWIAGVLLSAILAAVMSTLSCQLLVCSSAITEDLYRPFFRPGATQRELVWVGRIMVLLIAIISIVLAANPENRELGLVSYAWAGFGAAFGQVILISQLWLRMTRNGALVGMLIETATVIIWKQNAWFNLYEIIPGFLFASLAIFIVSLMGRAPSKAITDRFQQAEAQFQSR